MNRNAGPLKAEEKCGPDKPNSNRIHWFKRTITTRDGIGISSSTFTAAQGEVWKMIKKVLRNHLLAVVASKLKRRTMSMFSGLLEEYVLQTDPCPAQKKNHLIIFSLSATLGDYKAIHTC